MFHELLSRDREDGRATWQPQGVGPERRTLTVRRRVRRPRTPGFRLGEKDGHILGRSK